MDWDYHGDKVFESLKGMTLTKIEGQVGYDMLRLFPTEGPVIRMVYHQDCCASCILESVDGDLADLVGNPILQAEVVRNPEGMGAQSEYDESFTWTFYKLATIKGSVTMRWYGSSNGYYSETITVHPEDGQECWGCDYGGH